MNIAVAGAGYVGLSVAVLLAGKNRVTAVDTDPEKAESINNAAAEGFPEAASFLCGKKPDLRAFVSGRDAYRDADVVIICTPTDYNEGTGSLDTSSVEGVIEEVMEAGGGAYIVIRSTVPVGFTDRMNERYGTDRILFSPEFLREAHCLEDSFYPSRVIVGARCGEEPARMAKEFGSLMLDGALKSAPLLLMSPSEAEAAKLFANTYLAARVAFFNEADSFAESMGMDAGALISGICSDPRIGAHYNNPSFGYGGYCLPKDTKQLRGEFGEIPESMISAVVESNGTRKRFVAGRIWEKACSVTPGRAPVIGIYRLIMKSGSDNFRAAAVTDVMDILKEKGAEIVIYEPLLDEPEYGGFRVIGDPDEFFRHADIIAANRADGVPDMYKNKLYTRDIYGKN